MKHTILLMATALMLAIMDGGHVQQSLAQTEIISINGTSGRSKSSNIHNGGASVWWTWSAPATGSVTFNTRGSNFDTLLTVYTGDNLNNLTEIASNDDADGWFLLQSAVRFNAQQGQTYYIAVEGYNGAAGAIVLNWQAPSSLPETATETDDFSPNASISGASGRITGGNVGAGRQSGEPDHAGNNGGASVWWTWTAPATGSVTFDTRDSNFDTLLAVYIGDNLNNLTEIASNDDMNDWLLQSAVRFNAQRGETYHIAVDGYGGDMGAIVLNWHKDSVPMSADLNISVFGAGDLRVVSGGNQLDCTPTTICLGVFQMGNEVVIEANPNSGWAHERWVGCDQDSGSRCTIFVDGDRFASVAFRSAEPPAVEDHVVNLQTNQLEGLLEYDVANGVLVFESGTVGLSQWAIGDILLSGGNSTRSDDGSLPFARRILDIVNTADSRTRFHTIQASLDDIFRSGSLSYREQGEAVTVSTLVPDSVVVTQTDEPAFSNEVNVNLTFPDANGQEIVTVTGTLGLSVTPEFDIAFSPLEVRFVTHAQTSGSLSLNLGSVGKLFEAEKALPLRLKLAPITIFAGPVPVVITPVSELFLTIRVNVNNRIEPTVTYSISTTVGAHYKPGRGTKPIFSVDIDPGFELTDPDYNLVLAAETGIRGKLELRIYGTLGPYVNFGPFVGVRTECAWNHANIYGGARLSVGGEAAIFGYGVRYDIPAWERQWNLRRINLQPGADESVGLVTGLHIADPAIHSLTLSWNAPRNDCGLASYNVYRNGRLTAEDIATISYADNELAPDTRYCYQVAAVGSFGAETTPSTEVCGWTKGLETEVPNPPVNVMAEALSDSVILVMWDVPINARSVTDYVVYQHSGRDVFAVDGISGMASEVTLDGLQPDSEYCFSISSVSAAGISDHSEVVCAFTLQSSGRDDDYPVECIQERSIVEDINPLALPFGTYTEIAIRGFGAGNMYICYMSRTHTDPGFRVDRAASPYCPDVATPRNNIYDLDSWVARRTGEIGTGLPDYYIHKAYTYERIACPSYIIEEHKQETGQ